MVILFAGLGSGKSDEDDEPRMALPAERPVNLSDRHFVFLQTHFSEATLLEAAFLEAYSTDPRSFLLSFHISRLARRCRSLRALSTSSSSAEESAPSDAEAGKATLLNPGDESQWVRAQAFNEFVLLNQVRPPLLLVASRPVPSRPVASRLVPSGPVPSPPAAITSLPLCTSELNSCEG